MPTLPSYDLPRVIERLRGETVPSPDDASITASVAILLRAGPMGEAEVLLIQRAEREGDPWSGHMAFPGGRRDPTDPDVLATAVRETHEEVGVDVTAHATLVTRLGDVPLLVRAQNLDVRIAPFVFAMRRDVPLAPNHEVAATLWTPLAPLARGERASVYPFRWQGVDHEFPCYRLGERVVWGLTYAMLQGLFERVHG